MRDQILAALRDAVRACGLEAPADLDLDIPKQREHGEFSANVAMRLAKAAGRPPRALAEAIAAALEAADVDHLERVELAGPGFLNLHLAPSWVGAVAGEVIGAGSAFGTSTRLAGQRVNLEFVSANPTGPLHAGGARWVVTGDAIANLLASQGAQVHREYYLNDTGNQLLLFRASLSARYHGGPLPADGYQGEYMLELANEIRAAHGDALDDDELCEHGLERIIAGVRDDLARIGVSFETWFSERTLHARGDVAEVLRILDERHMIDDRDGALWLRTTDFGDQRDRVIVRADGTTTYLCNDLAYHRDKFARGFTHLINIWGADHHGQVKSLQAGLEALLGTHDEPEIILGQWVKFLRDGEELKLSKRAGTIVTLADILDDVDPDVTRMTFLMQGLDTKQTFDLTAVAAQSMENPVFYVQMAHARIASIARRAVEQGIVRRPLADVDLSVLTHEREADLARSLTQYSEIVAIAAAERAPHKVAHWLHDFASRFHAFYAACRVLGSPDDIAQARLWLTEACQIAFANALGLLGVRAPDEMARLDDAE